MLSGTRSEEGKCLCTRVMIQMWPVINADVTGVYHCSEYMKWPKMLNYKGLPLYVFISCVRITSRNSLLALRGPYQ